MVYLLSAVKHRFYEERWYWSSAIVAICTLLDGLIRSFMILASGGDLHLGVYLFTYGRTCSILEWRIGSYCAWLVVA